LFPGEKTSLYRFLLIYISSSLLLFAVGLIILFGFEKHRLIDHQYHILKTQTTKLIPILKQLHSSQESELIYPQYSEFKSAIYDIDANYIFGDFHPKSPNLNKEFYKKDDMIISVQSVSPHFLGATYLVVQKAIDYAPINSLKNRLFFAFTVAIFFISLLAFWLGKLFLSPMRNSITLLDNFIKDTTHELNTPVSTILANAELLKSFHPELQNSTELIRIENASKRLSRIYDDLAYITLNHKRHSNIVSLDVSVFLRERVEYFKVIALAKRIKFTYDITDNITLNIDQEDMTRIIDNLLGNAFKYTMTKGKIKVTLNEHHLSIEDNGIGIHEDVKKEVLKRFVRANKSEGGFGLGLSIISEITKHYNYDIKIESELDIGTKVSVIWAK
jgi:two-component system OmpR family sensor kinase